jgi:rhodanese-related sulfurtransferase
MNRHSLILLALLAGCGGGGAAQTSEQTASTGGETEQQAQFAQISVDEVESALNRPEAPAAVFDANSPETYAEHHVPGATWVDYDALSAEQLPADRDRQLVFYCANEQCEASHVAAQRAVALGYSNVAVMGAGIQGWVAAGKPVETGAAQAEAAPAAQ